MTDNGICVILVLVEEVVHTRESNLIDVFVNLFFCHTDTTVTDGKRTLFAIQFYLNGQITQLAFVVTTISQRLQLLRSIHSVRYHFTKKDLMI